jgi:hypothetical protein
MEGVLENGWVLLPSHSAATKEARTLLGIAMHLGKCGSGCSSSIPT